MATEEPLLNKFHPHWHHTMIRIKDPNATIPFYEKHFGMKLITKYTFSQWKYSLYFLAILRPGEQVPGEPGSPEANSFLWNYNGTILELTHNHGTETNPDFKHNNGNVEPNRGFGHVAINNVYV
jgi:lactoylglutathione lyase